MPTHQSVKLFVNNLINFIEDTFLLIPTDNLRDNIVTYIESLAMCRAFVNDTIYDIEKDTMIGQCVFIYNRPSGYSTFEVISYRFILIYSRNLKLLMIMSKQIKDKYSLKNPLLFKHLIKYLHT